MRCRDPLFPGHFASCINHTRIRDSVRPSMGLPFSIRLSVGVEMFIIFAASRKLILCAQRHFVSNTPSIMK